MDYHFLLQGIFLQGSNPHLLCLLRWQAGSLPLAPPGKHKYKKDWLKDVLCSSVFFRKIFEIIKKSSYKCISSLSSIFQTSMYSCSSHCPESVLIYLTCCYQWENSKFHGGTGLRKHCMFPLSRLILYVLLEHFFDSTLSQIFVTTMGTSPR